MFQVNKTVKQRFQIDSHLNPLRGCIFENNRTQDLQYICKYRCAFGRIFSIVFPVNVRKKKISFSFYIIVMLKRKDVFELFQYFFKNVPKGSNFPT